jgi:Ca-activated chloride channel homolog
MRWLSSWAFWLLIPLGLLFFIQLTRSGKKRAALQFSSAMLVRGVSKGLRARFALLPFVLKGLALACAVVALARPQEANSKVNRSVEGIDIMITLDISDSMDIEDMEPRDRITAAKAVIKKFIQGRGSDRIGLVLFGGESFTKVPLTLDYEILLSAVDDIETEGLKQGTAIGVALANAVARLRESTAKSRVLILLTDGESNSGTIDPDTALEIAKGYGIKIYTIGIGQDGQAQLPVYTKDAFGNRVKHYQPIHSTVNDELLQKLADDTGGKYFRATDTEGLRKVFASIDRLEKTKIQVNEYMKYTEHFDRWLYWAVIFYGLQLVLSRTVLRRAP